MGLDVGSYKNWKKVKVVYHKPILKENLQISGEKITQLGSLLYKRAGKDYHNYIFSLSGHNAVADFYPESLNRWISRGQQLKELLEKHFKENEREEYKILIDALGMKCAILKKFENKQFQLYSFERLEKYKRDIWDHDGYVDTKFPNEEILDTFEKVKKMYAIDLYPYIINTEAVEYIKDENVNHNIKDAMRLADKIITLDKDKTILYERSTKPLYINEVLKECIRLWKLGAKLEYS